MGVDAVMVVRIPFKPSDEIQRLVPEWAYRLGEAIGPTHFFVDSDEDLQRKSPGASPQRALNLWLPGDEENSYELRGIEHDEHHACLWVSLSGRYYGPGYERGDPWVYVAVAEWLERNIHGAVVFYGGDSDDTIGLFDKAERERLIEHWAHSGGIPYNQRGSRMMGDPQPPTCPLCTFAASQFGMGGGFASWTCLGCGRHWVWVTGYDKPRAFPADRFGRWDSFGAAERMRAELAAHPAPEAS